MKFIVNATIILLLAIYINSCSIVDQYSTFKPIVGTEDTTTVSYHYTKPHSADTLENGAIIYKNLPIKFMCLKSNDSISVYLEPFYGGKPILFGPLYLPIIPNIFYPFIFFHDNRVQNYNIVMSSLQDSMNICNFSFYRNKKKIDPAEINIVNLVNLPYNNKEFVVQPWENNVLDCILRPKTYYLFSFNIRTFTTKEIKIKYSEKTILHIKRKKKLKHEIIFGS